MAILITLGIYLAAVLVVGAGHAALLVAEDRHLLQTGAGRFDLGGHPAAEQERPVPAATDYLFPEAGDNPCRQQAAGDSWH